MQYTRASVLLILCAGFAASCASTKRAVIYRDPAFTDYEPLKSRSAFLLLEPIDITSVVQEFIVAFDGKPASGETFIRDVLRQCFTGGRDLSRSATPVRLSLVDLLSISSADSTTGTLQVSSDAYGVASVSVERPKPLQAAMTAADCDYLIIISGIAITRGDILKGPMGESRARGAPTILGGTENRVVTMSAQVLVLRAASMFPVWNGFATGQHFIHRTFTKNTVDGVTEAFAYDLWRALD